MRFATNSESYTYSNSVPMYISGMLLRSLWCSFSTKQLLRAGLQTCRPLSTATLNTVQVQRLLMKTTSQDECRMLDVTWTDGTTHRYPFMYLRDNCQCPLCFHKASQKRIFDAVSDLDNDITSKSVCVEDSGEKLRIQWPDNHVSEFGSDWLFERSLPTSQMPRPKEERERCIREVEFWGSELTGKVPQFGFDAIMNDDATLLSWLTSLSRIGLSQITDVPAEQGHVQRLGDRVGWLKRTTYGHTYDVQTKWSKYNVAYTSQYIPPHTDLPHQQYKPGIQFLQCIKQAQTDGGDNCFTDGFNVIQQLKKQDRAAYDLLSTTLVLWEACSQDAGVDKFHHRLARPIIELDTRGRLARINHNEGTRQLFVNTPVEKQMEAYRAYYVITSLLRHRDNIVWHKMQPGEMMVMDNERILHGRSAFSIEGGGDRWLHGAYMDWDVANSKIRLLATKLGVPCPI